MVDSLKGFARRAAAFVVARKSLWTVLDATVLRLLRLLDAEHAQMRTGRRFDQRDQLIAAAISDVCTDLVVRHGPFAGMRYNSANADGSELFPKLLGSYERELHPVLEDIGARDYTDIVVVGCAEGYYAVGLARRIDRVRVHAFDTNPAALVRCRLMAAQNGVADRVVLGSECTPADIVRLAIAPRLLVLSDCEGFEDGLFTPDVVTALGRHDVLVEVHDFIDIEISGRLRRRFEATHHLTVLTSVDDIVKARTYDYQELAAYTVGQRRDLLAERRPTIMEWFWLESRTRAAERHRSEGLGG